MSNNTIDQNLLRQIFFISLIVLIGIVLFVNLSFFIPALLGAVTFYVLMRDKMFYLTEKRKWKKGRTAMTLMLLSFLIILLPIGILANMLASKISFAVQHSGELMSSVTTMIEKLEKSLGYNLMSEDLIQKIAPFLQTLLPKILNVTVNTISIIAAMYFMLYFMLVNGRYMEDALYEYIPLKDSNVDLIGEEIHRNVIANAIGIPLIALIQGVVGLIGYLIIGVDEPFLWFMATCITAMLPVVGAALVYVPLTIMFFVQGETWRGIAMGLWGFVLIGLVDNLFRFIINKRYGDIHPLITIFGVIIGIQLFGFIGLIFGPLLISIFIVSLKVYSNEFLTKRRETKRTK
jgi:predicted PurR-regulated permease PerM